MKFDVAIGLAFFLLFPSVFESCSIPGISDGFWNRSLTLTRELSQSEQCGSLVVATIITNAYDKLSHAPGGLFDKSTTCCVAVVDIITWDSFSLTERVLGVGQTVPIIRGWHVVMEDNMYWENNQCNVRTFKSLTLKFFPYSKAIFYLDGTWKIMVPFKQLFRTALKNDTEIALLLHPERTDARLEMSTVTYLHLTPTEVVARQRREYDIEANREYHTKHLYQGNFCFRRNTPRTRVFECLWYADIMSYSHRDQLSLTKAITDSGLDPYTGKVRQNNFVLRKSAHKNTVNRVYNRNKEEPVIYPCFSSKPRDSSHSFNFSHHISEAVKELKIEQEERRKPAATSIRNKLTKQKHSFVPNLKPRTKYVTHMKGIREGMKKNESATPTKEDSTQMKALTKHSLAPNLKTRPKYVTHMKGIREGMKKNETATPKEDSTQMKALKERLQKNETAAPTKDITHMKELKKNETAAPTKKKTAAPIKKNRVRRMANRF
jgi:TOD1/MUCI70, glycosyltransferase-like domain